jgi:hypothetical protein
MNPRQAKLALLEEANHVSFVPRWVPALVRAHPFTTTLGALAVGLAAGALPSARRRLFRSARGAIKGVGIATTVASLLVELNHHRR